MGISPIQLLIVLVIVVIIFGGKRLRTLGADVAHAIKGFKEVTGSGESTSTPTSEPPRANPTTQGRVIEGEIKPQTERKPPENP